MSASVDKSHFSFTKTRFAIFASSLLNEPLYYATGLLALILRKHLNASVFQISLLVMLKPTVSIFSFYWSSFIRGRKSVLRKNFVIASILGRVPYLLFPFVDNIWFFLFSGAIYMLFYRAANPAWLEMMKLNLDSGSYKKYYSLSSAIGFAEGAILAISCGWILDYNSDHWKLLFCVSAIVGLIGTFVQARIPVLGEEEDTSPKISIKESITKPWVDGYNLIRKRPDFAKFQWGFMLGGAGLMLFQPALPIFFADVLKISYIDFSIGIIICRGLGSSIASPLWGRWMHELSVSKQMTLMLVLFALFPLVLYFSVFNLFWFYFAYFIYGVATSGSHVVWNLSGPLFSDKKDSSMYSGVNVIMVGLRGCVIPPIGGILCVILGPVFLLIMGSSICLFAGSQMLFKGRKKLRATIP